MSSDFAPENAPPLRYGIAFGSNRGDRLANLSEAKRQLLRVSYEPGTALFSPVFESAPVNCAPGCSAFLNAVGELSLPLLPPAALELCQGIEADLGREAKRPVNAPRPIDLDLLYAGEETSDTAELTLPHPRLAVRRFVLEPLAAIRPDLSPPGFELTAAELLQNLVSDEPALRKVCDIW